MSFLGLFDPGFAASASFIRFQPSQEEGEHFRPRKKNREKGAKAT
jgi:hypothetical protein